MCDSIFSSRIKASTGRCLKCGTKLTSANFSEADLAALKTAVLGDVITRSDIYQSSSPEEHRAFLALLEENNNSRNNSKNNNSNNKNSNSKNNSQFDIVIDGLNVALIRTPGIGNTVKPIG